jgi:hypothetical protein
MSEQAPDRLWSGIDIPKTLAGVLAAISAAVVGSFLGVAGTLVGAAVASVIGSVGTEIYQRSIHRGAKKLQTIAPTFIKVPAAIGTPEVAAATEADSPSHTVAEPVKRQIRWSRIAMIAGAMFVLAMGSLTLAELASGSSAASWTGNGNGAGTTLGGVVKSSDKKVTPTPTPAATPTDKAPVDQATQPATEPTSGDQGAEPTTGPTAEAPSTDTPLDTDTQPPAGDTQDQNLDQNSDQSGSGGTE